MSDAGGHGKATLSELKEVLKETLEAKGTLGQIKARIRAEIFAALDDEQVPKPALSNENLIINELIREYLEYNGYRHALAVFLPESGQPTEKPFHRDFLSRELNIQEDPRFDQIPLLYSILATLQQNQGDSWALSMLNKWKSWSVKMDNYVLLLAEEITEAAERINNAMATNRDEGTTALQDQQPTTTGELKNALASISLSMDSDHKNTNNNNNSNLIGRSTIDQPVVGGLSDPSPVVFQR